MCGIVGVVGSTTAVNDVLEGLKRLEYRGYDSAGIATLSGKEVAVRKAVGKIKNLESLLLEQPFTNNLNIAIGHTRWATHGEPTTTNAHPHTANPVAVVHNGIIENYLGLRKNLQQQGFNFYSDTDTETLPALISKHIKEGKGELDAVLETVKEAEGAFAFAAIFESDADTLIATRRSAPLVVGVGQGQNYIGSDPIALAAYTSDFIFLENDDIALVTADSIKIYNPEGGLIERPVKTLDMDNTAATKGNYPHYMLKEIYEQPDVISKTLSAYLSEDLTDIIIPDLPIDLATVPQITIVACGTSWHAGLVGKYWLERYTRIPVNVDVASEFRYRNPPLAKGGVTLLISQSGETADSLAALEHIKENGQHVIAVVNVPESSIDREADVSFYTHAGPEISVASTKAFTTQLTVLALLTLKIAEQKGLMSKDEQLELLKALKELPNRMNIMDALSEQCKEVAQTFVGANSSLYLGRDIMYPLALEGALKLKEISYIHAEGLAAGEMKHGPIALIEKSVPVVFASPYDKLFEKTLSNLKEVEARKGEVVLFTDFKGKEKAGENDTRRVITLPDIPEFIAPIMYSLPMQLLAYHTAVLKGTDVDQPRNLAKSVTVE
ncbi:MAG: glutamine--fructose-6-phosphate transaminase (isomerizing) [Magnetococcales bacterium]|nr:glutamine--fructose-6-phosphate transaminase (isomerizing) [Magnetococcales bacterium]|tara:strand:- start:4423 stop:6255 length:1833 start_codon:yes stop_codon:yes gene_type:complete